MAGPGPHPEPPADLRHREPLLLETRQHWFRSYRLTQEPLRLSRSAQNRFDDPQMKYGVLYVAEDEHGAFIETFGQSTGISSITVSALSRRGLVRVEADRPLSLINLVDMGGLARIGADGRLCAGDRAVAQRWSRALHDHPARPDGLYYPARHDLSRRVPTRPRPSAPGPHPGTDPCWARSLIPTGSRCSRIDARVDIGGPLRVRMPMTRTQSTEISPRHRGRPPQLRLRPHGPALDDMAELLEALDVARRVGVGPAGLREVHVGVHDLRS